MPYKRRYKKRRPKRRKPKAAMFMQLGSSGPFPKQALTAHRGVVRFSIDASNDVPVIHQFYLNGMHDYDVTGASTQQPMGFDQMAAFYANYCVLGTKINVKALGTSNTAASQAIVGLSIHSNQSFTPTNPEVIIERGNCSYATIGGFSGSDASRQITRKVSMRKWYGVNPTTDDEKCATAGANPVDGIFGTVWAAPLEPNANAQVIHFIATIDFIAKWYNLKQVNAS